MSGFTKTFTKYGEGTATYSSSTETRINSTDPGMKNDVDKTRLDLIPVDVLEAEARVFSHGAKKYGDYNYYKGLKYSRLFSAIRRHLDAFWRGDDADPDTGESHLAHARCGLAMLMTLFNKPEFDDRPKFLRKKEKDKKE